MPTRGNGVNGAVHEVAERARNLARLEVELAGLELRRKASALGAGVGLMVAGAVLAMFALGFLLATIAVALAIVLPAWLAVLAVGVSLALAAAGVVAIGSRRLQRGVPPVPEQAIAEAKLTGEALKARSGG